MIVANHVSWLDVFVLNALYPATFIAKSEVSRWPLIGWLCKRSGTIFIERSVRKNTSTVNKHIASQLEQGICVALFPEGTTSDGRQAGHFHSSLIQPAIEVGAPLYPIALRYLDEAGEQSYATAFTGEMTLVQSIVQILRCRHLDALAIFTPALSTTEQNRRVLARLAQEAISQELHCLQTKQPKLAQSEAYAIPQAIFSTKQDYSLLLESQFNQLIR
jgi:1-acyl-sn-glycerol-3-phosphate acyltransferase